nr:MobT family relaxase [Scatolibacter rhodanostii]
MKAKRESYGISQNRLATALGVSREYLNRLENGKYQVQSIEKKNYIIEVLERFDPNAPLNLMFDYLRIRFPTTNARAIIENLLQMRFDQMLHEDYAYYKYAEHYAYGDIMVMVSPDEEKGVLLELKGKGCRQFENVLVAQCRSWYEFLTDCLCAEGIIKRLDLAVNDMKGILDIGELIKKSETEECISLFRTFNSYSSGEFTRETDEDKLGMGRTLYLGSFKSEIYFCIYEKDYEQYIKNGVPIEEAPIKNRFEIRLMNDRAENALKDLLTYQNEEKTVFEIINRYVTFVDRNPKQPKKSRWNINPLWEYFIGKDRAKLKLTTQPEPYTYDRTINWLGTQVAPTLKLSMKIDEKNGTNTVNRIIENAKLSEKHMRIFKQQTTPIEEVIIPR